MSVEQAIHQRWSATFDLTTLLPVSNLFTGAAYGNPALPYVVLNQQGNSPLLRTSSGTTVDETLLRFNLWSADLEQGKAIARQVEQAFDSSTLDVLDNTCLAVRRVAGNEQLEDDGTWHITLDYLVVLEHRRGG